MEGIKTEQDFFLKELRAGTAGAHDLLEQNRVSQAIINSTVTRDDYIAYLKSFYGFVKPLEEMIYPIAQSAVQNAPKRRRSHLLHADLRFFGFSDEEIAALPVYDFSHKENSDLATAIGTMYVMEGSTLGGQVICRQLNKSLGLQAPEGMRFFYGHGPGTGPMWKEFIGNFTAVAVESGEQKKIIAAATDTFARFQQWLAGI
jgi:heme oxygenase